MEIWQLQVYWGRKGGTEFWSPPIGPFYSSKEAERAAVKLRKALRKGGRRWQGRVKTSKLISLDHAIVFAQQRDSADYDD